MNLEGNQNHFNDDDDDDDASATVEIVDYDDSDGIMTVRGSQLEGRHGRREEQTVSQISEGDLSVT